MSVESEPAEPAVPAGPAERVDAIDRRLDRAIHQVLMPGLLEGPDQDPPAWLVDAIGRGLGGVCLFAQNVAGPIESVRAATDRLHALGPELIVACDEEGGEVTRLDAAEGSPWPTPHALGLLDDPGLTRAVGAGVGARCAAAGIDLTFAPSLDVNSDPDNPIIGLRSFGSDAEVVTREGLVFLAGIESAGTLGCVKHFPGHGDTAVDSHLGLPVVEADRALFRARDLAPFAAAVTAGVRAVMTAHVAVPALDPTPLGGVPDAGPTPATLSATLIGLLRDELGFAGVIVSDALDMRAISAGVGRGAGAVLALRAGVDLICIGNPGYPARYDPAQILDEVRTAIAAAVHRGELSIDRLEQAGQRVRALRRRRATTDPAAPPDPLESIAAAREVTRRTVTSSPRSADPTDPTDPVDPTDPADSTDPAHPASGPTAPLLLIPLHGSASIAVANRRSPVLAAIEQSWPAGVSTWRPDLDQDPAESARVHVGPVVVVVRSPHRQPAQASALASVLAARPDALVVMTGLPDERDRLGRRWVLTRGDTRAAADELRARLGSLVG